MNFVLALRAGITLLAGLVIVGCAKEGASPGDCTDGFDNDGDGLFDCGDPDCSESEECDEGADDDDDATAGDDDDDDGDDDDDTTPTTDDDDDDTTPADDDDDVSDPAITGYAILTLLHQLYPDGWDPPAESVARATAQFFPPENMPVVEEVLWGGVLPSVGQCGTYDAMTDPTYPSFTGWFAGDSVTLSGPIDIEAPLVPMSSTYWTDDMDASNYVAGVYDLVIPGGDDLGAGTIVDLIDAVQPFEVTPALDPGVFDAGLLNNGLGFGMDRSCDHPVARLDVYGAGLAYVESVVCAFPAGNHLAIPSSYTSSYGSALAIVVYIECYSEMLAIAPNGEFTMGIGRVVNIGIMYSG